MQWDCISVSWNLLPNRMAGRSCVLPVLPNGLGIGVVGPTTLWASIYCMRLGSTKQWATNVYDMGCITDGTLRNRDKPPRGMSRRVGSFIIGTFDI
jgi:hypothetical protein